VRNEMFHEMAPIVSDDLQTVDFPIAEIVREDSLRPREQRDPATVESYVADMIAGADFPAVDLVRTSDGKHYLAGGDHRIEAALKNKQAHIKAIIRDGTVDDARWVAAGSNRTNGLRRSNGDKKQAIRMAILAEPGAGNDEVARHVGVSTSWVEKTRGQMQKNGELTKPDSTELSSRRETASGGQRRTHNLSVEQKRDILAALDAGEKAKDLAKKYGVTAETISRLRKKAKKESEEGKSATNGDAGGKGSGHDVPGTGASDGHEPPAAPTNPQQPMIPEPDIVTGPTDPTNGRRAQDLLVLLHRADEILTDASGIIKSLQSESIDRHECGTIVRDILRAAEFLAGHLATPLSPKPMELPQNQGPAGAEAENPKAQHEIGQVPTDTSADKTATGGQSATTGKSDSQPHAGAASNDPKPSTLEQSVEEETKPSPSTDAAGGIDVAIG
jgi:transposase